MPVALSPNPKSRTRKLSQSIHQQRNVQEVILGDLRVETWYPSFYPEELIGKAVERLFVCKYCFKYTTKLIHYIQHSNRCCSLKETGPVGSLIYKQDNISIYEVDGLEHKMFAQNLSLFAKLFLDTKSVFFDVTTFTYYTLAFSDPNSTEQHATIVGFFSKEKLSWDSNNLACICVFPPWQRKGFGQILMDASYVMSKWDEVLGGPEKPLSDLGRLGYVAYWSATIARYVINIKTPDQTTVREISDATYILPEDVIYAMNEMEILEPRADEKQKAVINKNAVIKWMNKHKISMTSPVDRSAFIRMPRSLKTHYDEDDDEDESIVT